MAPEVILRPDTRSEVIEFEGARGTYCGNCGITYVVLFTVLRTIYTTVNTSILNNGNVEILSEGGK